MTSATPALSPEITLAHRYLMDVGGDMASIAVQVGDTAHADIGTRVITMSSTASEQSTAAHLVYHLALIAHGHGQEEAALRETERVLGSVMDSETIAGYLGVPVEVA